MNTKTKQKQDDYLYREFCHDARYIPQLNNPYTIEVNGKRLYSTETDDLFNQYVKAIKGRGNQQ